jgi:hypothetical protein
MQQIYLIWSHQISSNKENLVYERGSPEMEFSPKIVKADKEREFERALPTTIYQVGSLKSMGKIQTSIVPR